MRIAGKASHCLRRTSECLRQSAAQALSRGRHVLCHAHLTLPKHPVHAEPHAHPRVDWRAHSDVSGRLERECGARTLTPYTSHEAYARLMRRPAPADARYARCRVRVAAPRRAPSDDRLQSRLNRERLLNTWQTRDTPLFFLTLQSRLNRERLLNGQILKGG